MGIGNKIAERRKSLKLSQEQLAEKANISQTHISCVERERYNPSIELLGKIAEALDCQLYIDLIPNGAPTPDLEHIAPVTTSTEYSNVSELQTVPTWVTLEQASAATILSIAIEKIKLERDSMSNAERKTIEGLIETSKEVMEI